MDDRITSTPAGEPILRVADLNVRYAGGELAVDGATLGVDPGEVVVVVGPNGAGKSSLLRAIAGYTRHDGIRAQGTVEFRGRNVLARDPAAMARSGLCYIPERDKVFRNLTIEENLRLFLQRRRSKEGAGADLESVFEMYPWMKVRRKTLAGYLSGGEQQMLALSGLVLARPDVGLIDEPSLGLAPIIVNDIVATLDELRRKFGLALLVVDQNVRATIGLADRVYTMDAGILTQRSAETLEVASLASLTSLAQPTAATGGSEAASHNGSDLPSDDGEVPQGVARPGASAVTLAVESLHLSFGGLKALSDVTFSVSSGEVVGLVGPNGAGKTALLNCITGFYRPDGGSIRFADAPMSGESPPRIALRGIARTFQHAASIQQMGCRDVLLLGAERSLPSGVLRYLTPFVRGGERAAVAKTYAVARELEIEDHVVANTPFELLPYGTRKLVDLGRALMSEPDVLIMDEPAAGLNSDEKTAMHEAIARLRRQRRISLILVEHDLNFVASMCDRLVVLNAGQIIADGGVAHVLQLPEVVDCYIGSDDAGEVRQAAGTPTRESAPPTELLPRPGTGDRREPERLQATRQNAQERP